jgi:prepilin-type N-terminal cleavage/methylation domain-containing protein
MKRHAFTLIELLVVISIIALLLSILVPSLAKVKEAGRRAVCGSRMTDLPMSRWQSQGRSFHIFYVLFTCPVL